MIMTGFDKNLTLLSGGALSVSVFAPIGRSRGSAPVNTRESING